MYPRMNTYPSIDETKLDKPKLLAFAGYKAGMLHIIAKDTTKGSATFGEDISLPVTVLDCPPMLAVGVRAYFAGPSGLSIITEAWADKLPKGFELKRKRKKKIKGKKAKDKKKGEKEKKGRPSARTQIAKMKKELDTISSVCLVIWDAFRKDPFENGETRISFRTTFSAAVMGSTTPISRLFSGICATPALIISPGVWFV